MRSFHRHIALASTVLIAALAAGCGTGPDEAGGDGEAAAEPTTSPSAAEVPEVEGVENFYGEYGDYVTLTEAIRSGDVTAEELEYPWVAQQDHVDAAADWDGTNPTYELSPAAGGNHLSQWQTCTGSVYDAPLVEGNAVHSMEHGAVWLTYDPELVDQAQIDALAAKIAGRDYSLMSPYPGLGTAVSLQSWGNRYRTEDPADANIDAYLDAYILNERFNPEAMATCAGGLTTTAG